MLRAANSFNPSSKVCLTRSSGFASHAVRKIYNGIFQEFNFLSCFPRKQHHFGLVTTPPPIPDHFFTATIFLSVAIGYAYQNRFDVRCRMVEAIEKGCKEGTKQYLKDKTSLTDDEKRFLKEQESKALDFLSRLQ